jgi:hypothetical protein
MLGGSEGARNHKYGGQHDLPLTCGGARLWPERLVPLAPLSFRFIFLPYIFLPTLVMAKTWGQKNTENEAARSLKDAASFITIGHHRPAGRLYRGAVYPCRKTFTLAENRVPGRD